MGPSGRVVIADDLEDVRWALAELLRRQGMEVYEAGDGASALQMIGVRRPDVAVFDVRMPGVNGIDALRQVKRLYANLPVILFSAYAEVQEAVEAIKAGAFDYLVRPFDHQGFVGSIKAALLSRRLKDDLQEPGGPCASLLAQQMGPSDKVQQLSAEISRVAPTNLTVLISGESGSGKELAATAIHRLSRRASKPFIVVDCGGIPESLIENELFGHERGAFTGADRTTIGKFEAAEEGTLFLDELCNLPFGLQSKLLRGLETKEIFRIGSTTTRKVDVRVVAATNRDLMSLVAAGNFREDLFYRLSEYTIGVPPLRERREDIVFLAQRFLDSANKEFQTNLYGFTPSAIDRMLGYDWPGNVRELRNVLTRAVLRAIDLIDVEHLGLPDGKGWESGLANSFLPPAGRPLPLKEIVHRQTVRLERQVLCEVLQQTGGNKAQAARLLGIDYKTMRTKIRQYEIGPQGVAHPGESQLSSETGKARGNCSIPEGVEPASIADGSEKELLERAERNGGECT
jgi:two-component system nitrogen regulation response regulator GlnG